MKDETLQMEFYNQQKWRLIHDRADQLIATKNGTILAAVYLSPDERVRQDQANFIEMLMAFAALSTP